MAPTIESIIAGLRSEVEQAETRADRARAEIREIVNAADAEKRSMLTESESRRSDSLFAEVETADAAAKAARIKLANAEKVKAEEDESTRRSRIVIPANAPAAPGESVSVPMGACSTALPLPLIALSGAMPTLAADQVLSDAIGAAMALGLDKAILFGQLGATGTNDEGAAYGLASPSPKGVLKTLVDDGTQIIGSFPTNGTAQTNATPWLELVATYYAVKRQNEIPKAVVSNDVLVQQYRKYVRQYLSAIAAAGSSAGSAMADQ